MISSREDERKHFLTTQGLQDEAIEPLTADASFRRYFRLTDFRPATLLMDAPPPLEDVRPFINVARHLTSLGFRAPELRAYDEHNGFVLLEDFGEQTFTRLLANDRPVISEQDLYRLAVDVLLKLHAHRDSKNIAVAPYDLTSLVREASLFSEWYLPAALGHRTASDVNAQWEEAWSNLLSRFPATTSSLVLRDFHVDNLMIVDTDLSSAITQPLSVEQCGLLDFQDAVIGNPAYDLVSLLQDARRDVPIDIENTAIQYYFDHNEAIGSETDRQVFQRSYRMLGAQRHAKVAGIFVRLAARDDKHSYLQHVPRVLNLLKRSVNPEQDVDGDFVEIRRWLDEHLGEASHWPLPDQQNLHVVANFP